jgi:threonyl-tRNA synthetase
LKAQRVLGLSVDHVRLSMRDDAAGWLGTDEQWDRAQQELREAAHAVLAEDELGLTEEAGEAAFYGPKLDLQVADGRGHEETIATVQIDFTQPERFDLTYVADDGGKHRVVMIHRGTVGSMERVAAAVLERYQGRLPFWLAPIQVVVLPVAAAQDAAARALVDDLRARGLRARADHEGSLGGRIRSARLRRDHLIAVVGPQEEHDGTVQVTDVGSGTRAVVPVDQLADRLAAAYGSRSAHVEWTEAP